MFTKKTKYLEVDEERKYIKRKQVNKTWWGPHKSLYKIWGFVGVKSTN